MASQHARQRQHGVFTMHSAAVSLVAACVAIFGSHVGPGVPDSLVAVVFLCSGHHLPVGPEMTAAEQSCSAPEALCSKLAH